MAALAGAAVLIRGEYLVVGVVCGLLAVLWLLQKRFIRLAADEHGIRVWNWSKRTFAWSGVADIKLLPRTWWGSQRMEITLDDGRRVRPWAAKTGYKSGYSYAEIDRVLRRLLTMRREALGIADPPQLAAALTAARAGDPRPIDGLLASHEIDAALYGQRLHELADSGDVDLELLRKRRRELL